VEGNTLVAESQIKNIAEKNISGQYFYLFAKNNVVIYPEGAILKEIYSMPLIKEAQLKVHAIRSRFL